MTLRPFALVVGVGLWALGAGAVAQDRPRSDTHPPGGNPHLKNEASIRNGMMQYRIQCGECHGLDAKGNRGPDLTLVLARGMTDEMLFKTIRQGMPGTEMSANRTSADDDILMLVAYLRSLATVGPPEAPIGNVENGRQLFAAQCSLCHRVGGRGGRLGPDLTRIGAARSRAALERDIRSPSEAIPESYETVTLVTSDGRRIRGAMKDEDAFSILIMDVHERLQGYRKAGLKDVIYEKASLMPAYGPDRLSDAQLTDLVGYLSTLREAAPASTSFSR